MEVSFQVGKFIKLTIILFFTLARRVDEVSMRLSLIEQIIKDANMMYILFSVKHPQTFSES